MTLRLLRRRVGPRCGLEATGSRRHEYYRSMFGRTRALCIVLIVVSAACKSGDGSSSGPSADRLTVVVTMFEDQIGKLEMKIAKGERCFTVVEGWIRSERMGELRDRFDAEDGFSMGVAKLRKTFSDQFDIVAIGFDVYKTQLGDRFDAVAHRFKSWEVAYQAAVQACKQCFGPADEPTSEAELYRKLDRERTCLVP